MHSSFIVGFIFDKSFNSGLSGATEFAKIIAFRHHFASSRTQNSLFTLIPRHGILLVPCASNINSSMVLKIANGTPITLIVNNYLTTDGLS